MIAAEFDMPPDVEEALRKSVRASGPAPVLDAIEAAAARAIDTPAGRYWARLAEAIREDFG